LTENECIQAGLPPYGFDGGMYAFGKHVYNYGKEKPYVEYCGTHWFQPHIRMLTELLQSSGGGVLLDSMTFYLLFNTMKKIKVFVHECFNCHHVMTRMYLANTHHVVLLQSLQPSDLLS